MVQTSILRQIVTTPVPLATHANDVFISYSCKDKAFVKKLDTYLRKLNRDPWVDWDDIHKGEDWWTSIQRGIEEADTFIFVLSPDSLASSVCRDEIEYAAQYHKRFLPIVRRESFDIQQLHPAISRHNWLFFRESDDFKTAFKEFLQALDTDLEYVRAHTRLLVRTLEWQNKQQDNSYLLRGTDLDDAQQWLGQGINKEPRPTDGQVSYISASKNARTVALKARQKARWIIVLTAVLANLAFVAGGLYLITGRTDDAAQQSMEFRWIDTYLEAEAEFPDYANDFAALAEIEKPTEQDDWENDSLLQQHETWLQAIQELEPKSRPITYIAGDRDDEVRIIGDLFRKTNPSEAYPFLKPVAITSENWEMEEGLGELTLEDVKDVYSELEEGEDTSFSIYGPIRDESGDTIGALELRYDADAYLDEYDRYSDAVRDSLGHSMPWVYTIAFVWFALSSWIILWATQTSKDG